MNKVVLLAICSIFLTGSFAWADKSRTQRCANWGEAFDFLAQCEEDGLDVWECHEVQVGSDELFCSCRTPSRPVTDPVLK